MLIQAAMPVGASPKYYQKPDDGLSPVAAYSVRLLSSTYAGALVNLRRSTDNTTQDFYPTDSGNFPIVQALAFAGVGNLFVATWYDQSGNTNNVSQGTTANQPQLVLNSLNGRPGVFWSGATAAMQLTKTTPNNMTPTTMTEFVTHITSDISAHRTFSSVNYPNTTSNAGWRSWSGESGNKFGLQISAGATPNFLGTTTAQTAGTPYAFAWSADGSKARAYINGTVDATTTNIGNIVYTAPTNSLIIGNINTNNQPFDGYQFDHIIFGSALNQAQISVLTANARAYYGF